MGRELKRVPFDFDWPLHKVWDGFINPFYTAEKCTVCDGTGYSKEAKHLYDQWYGLTDFNPTETGSTPLTIETPEVRKFAERNIRHMGYTSIDVLVNKEARRLCDLWNAEWCSHLDQDDVDALVAHDRLWDFTHYGIEHPTAEQVNVWNISSMGHDTLNCFICVEEKCKRLGYEVKCSVCGGDGEIWPCNAAKQLYESYEWIQPPAGDGWQLWENVSEGSPISPVFETKEAFIEYLISEGFSRKAAEGFTENGYAPSFSIGPEGLKENIEIYDKD